MKRLRVVFLVALTCTVLALVLRAARGPRGFATATDCLDAYREARANGDVESYWKCLGEPLRSETLRRFPDAQALADYLRQDMKEIKNWVELDGSNVEDRTAFVEIEEVRQAGKRCTRFHLEHSSDGWLIVGIEPRGEKALAIPYGTHISRVAEDAPAAPEPDE
jgi:hypothetical protein